MMQPRMQVDRNAESDGNPLVYRVKDLLQLARTDVGRAEKEFKKIGFEGQLDLARVLEGDDLQEWLLLSEDCTDLVRSLPAEQIHHAIQKIGEEDSLMLLTTASSTQQLNGFL